MDSRLGSQPWRPIPCFNATLFICIRWALTGLETEVFRGFSWFLLVTRRDTKTLVNKGFWGDFPEHPTGVVVQTSVNEWLRWLTSLSDFLQVTNG